MSKSLCSCVARGRKRKLEPPDLGPNNTTPEQSKGVLKHDDLWIQTHHSDDEGEGDEEDGKDRTVAAKCDDDYQRPAKLDLLGKEHVAASVFSFCACVICA